MDKLKLAWSSPQNCISSNYCRIPSIILIVIGFVAILITIYSLGRRILRNRKRKALVNRSGPSSLLKDYDEKDDKYPYEIINNNLSEEDEKLSKFNLPQSMLMSKSYIVESRPNTNEWSYSPVAMTQTPINGNINHHSNKEIYSTTPLQPYLENVNVTPLAAAAAPVSYGDETATRPVSSTSPLRGISPLMKDGMSDQSNQARESPVKKTLSQSIRNIQRKKNTQSQQQSSNMMRQSYNPNRVLGSRPYPAKPIQAPKSSLAPIYDSAI